MKSNWKLFVDKYYKYIGTVEVGMSKYTDTSRFISIMSMLREAELVEVKKGHT
ncbi:MAG: hypothetical protein R2799_16535 [Crocinitomicaceae bacterium]